MCMYYLFYYFYILFIAHFSIINYTVINIHQIEWKLLIILFEYFAKSRLRNCGYGYGRIRFKFKIRIREAIDRDLYKFLNVY